MSKLIQQQYQTPGKVYLVGAGPGAIDLITVRGAKLLEKADIVFYDALVDPEMLTLCPQAIQIEVGKRCGKLSSAQQFINKRLVDAAQKHQVIVRLKGGDPMIFGRANEEISALRDAGIDIDVVPGVTAACAGAAALGLSLTSREVARRLQFITAHSKDGEFPEDFQWSALADPRATTAVYMGKRTLPALSQRLLKEGMQHDTPAFLIERASTDEERIIKGTIADLPSLIADEELTGPVLLLIGHALLL